VISVVTSFAGHEWSSTSYLSSDINSQIILGI